MRWWTWAILAAVLAVVLTWAVLTRRIPCGCGEQEETQPAPAVAVTP